MTDENELSDALSRLERLEGDHELELFEAITIAEERLSEFKVETIGYGYRSKPLEETTVGPGRYEVALVRRMFETFRGYRTKHFAGTR